MWWYGRLATGFYRIIIVWYQLLTANLPVYNCHVVSVIGHWFTITIIMWYQPLAVLIYHYNLFGISYWPLIYHYNLCGTIQGSFTPFLSPFLSLSLFSAARLLTFSCDCMLRSVGQGKQKISSRNWIHLDKMAAEHSCSYWQTVLLTYLLSSFAEA